MNLKKSRIGIMTGMKLILPSISVILLFSLAVGAFQAPRVDDAALRNAEAGTDWLSYGMGWSEQRYRLYVFAVSP